MVQLYLVKFSRIFFNGIIPVFLKMPNGNLEIVPSFSTEMAEIKEGSKLVYLGKVFDFDL